MKVGNKTASNFSSSFRPQNLGGTFTHFFHHENDKTYSCYPINLNGQTRKIYGDNYSCLNQCSRRKTAFSIRQLLHTEGTMNPSLLSLRLLFFKSQTKEEENRTLRRLVVHASRDSYTLTFFRRDSLRV